MLSLCLLSVASAATNHAKLFSLLYFQYAQGWTSKYVRAKQLLRMQLFFNLRFMLSISASEFFREGF